MDIQEFFDVSYYSFPKVTRDIRYSINLWTDRRTSVDSLEKSNSNMDFDTALLGEKEIVRALLAYEKAPRTCTEDHDLYVLFKCYQYAVWSMPWDQEDMLQEWESLNKPDETADQDTLDQFQSVYDQLSCESPDDIVGSIIDTLSSRLSAKARFIMHGLYMQECVLCGNKHDAMMYQLLLYLAYPEQARNGREIKYCKECGEPFIRSSRRAEYCPKHSTGSARVKRHRREQAAKKKED